MHDEHLTRALTELPEERASPGFTTRVLARLDEAEARPRAALLPRLGLVAAAAAAVLAVVVAVGLRQEPSPAAGAAEARALLEEIRAEHERLERELSELQAASGPPVLYVGGDDSVDLVIDVGQVPERPEGTIQPALYK